MINKLSKLLIHFNVWWLNDGDAAQAQRSLRWESVLVLYASENFLGLSVLKTRLQRSNWDRWPGFKGHLSQPDLHLLHRPENAREALLEALSVNALADTNQPSFQLSFHVKLLDLDMWFLHHLSRSYHIMFHTQTHPKKLLQKLQLDTKQTDIKMLQFFFFSLFLLLSWKHIN